MYREVVYNEGASKVLWSMGENSYYLNIEDIKSGLPYFISHHLLPTLEESKYYETTTNYRKKVYVSVVCLSVYSEDPSGFRLESFNKLAVS